MVRRKRHECVGGTRGPCIVSCVSDMLGMRRVGGVCEMFMCCLGAVYEVRGGRMRGLGFGFNNLWEHGEC